MKTERKYQVNLNVQDWDSRQQCFVAGDENENLTEEVTLEEAKAVYLDHIANDHTKLRERANYHGAPVELKLQALDVEYDEDGDLRSSEFVETYCEQDAEGKYHDFLEYYSGPDATGKYVLWATNEGSKHNGQHRYDTDCLEQISEYAHRNLDRGELALRHCDDLSGAVYAEELFDTVEELAAYFSEKSDRYHTQGRLEDLAKMGALAGTIEVRHDEAGELSAQLPSGWTWDHEDEDYEKDGDTIYTFDTDGKLYAIKVLEPEEEEEHTATTGL